MFYILLLYLLLLIYEMFYILLKLWFFVTLIYL